MYVRMYVCMYVHMHVYTYVHSSVGQFFNNHINHGIRQGQLLTVINRFEKTINGLIIPALNSTWNSNCLHRRLYMELCIHTVYVGM